MSQISGPNFGGPVSGNSVGEIFVGVAMDLGPMRAGLRQAEAEVKDSAAKMQRDATVTIAGPSIGGAAFRGSGGPRGSADVGRFRNTDLIGEFAAAERPKRLLDRLRASTKEAGLLRGILSKLFWPVAIFTGVDRLLEGFRALNREASDFRGAIEGINASAIERVRDALLELRVVQGAITDVQAEQARITSEQVLAEKAIADELEKRLDHLGKLRGLLGSILQHYKEAFTENPAMLIPGVDILNILEEHQKRIAEANADAAKGMKEAEGHARTLRDLAKQKADIEAKAREDEERVQRRIREQAKRDITHTTIDARRIGPALDLLQRQRAGGNGWAGGR